MGETDWGEYFSCSDGQVHAQKIFNPILLIGGAVFPPCCLTWGQTVVGVMKKMVSSMKRLDKIQGQLEFGKCLPYIKFKYYQRKKVKFLSHVWLFVTPWTVAYQAPLSMGFSRQEYWRGLPFPSPTLSQFAWMTVHHWLALKRGSIISSTQRWKKFQTLFQVFCIKPKF